jgi:CheY-like chemotaxis protein
MHGGQVEAKSSGVGLGSEFIVRLPLAKVIDETKAAQKIPTPHGPSHRILIVDDNQDVVWTLSRLLRSRGNDIRVAYDGIDAVEEAKKFQPDVILLDLGLPKLNGLETAKLIRKQSWGKDMTLVALTGWGQQEDRRHTQEAGFNYHLVKPIDYAFLQNILAGINTQPSR